MLFQSVQNYCADIRDFCISRLVQTDVNLPVRSHGFDEAGQPVSAMKRLKDVAGVQQAPVCPIDNDLTAQRRLGADEKLNFLTGVKIGCGIGQKAIEFCRGDDTLTPLIQIDSDNIGAPLFHRRVLFSKGNQQILGQTPIEKSADRCLGDDLEPRKVADHGQGRLRGGNRTVLGIRVEKNGQAVARPTMSGNILLGEQYFAKFPSVEIDSAVGFSNDPEFIQRTDVWHVWRALTLAGYKLGHDVLDEKRLRIPGCRYKNEIGEAQVFDARGEITSDLIRGPHTEQR